MVTFAKLIFNLWLLNSKNTILNDVMVDDNGKFDDLTYAHPGGKVPRDRQENLQTDRKAWALAKTF